MDWKEVGRSIAPLAPMAGSILGGLIPFPGGSIIGQKLGEMIAGAFGVAPTPQAVSDAVANSTEETARAKINAAVEQARVQVQGFVDIEKAYAELVAKTLAETNETIRAETAGRVQLALQGMHEHWFFTAGRPASLWVFNIVSFCFGMMLTAATAKAAWVAADPLKVLADAWPLFASYFGPLCLVNGIYINARSTEKKAAIESGSPMPNAAPSKPDVVARPPTPAPAPLPSKPPAFSPKIPGDRS
jgi:hypothetical protein